MGRDAPTSGPVHQNRVLLSGVLATRPSRLHDEEAGSYLRLLLTVRVSNPRIRSDTLPVDVYSPRAELADADRGTPVAVEARTVYMTGRDEDGVAEWIRLVADGDAVGENPGGDKTGGVNQILVAGTVDERRSPLRQFGSGATSMILHIAAGSDVLPVTVWDPDPALVSAETGTPVAVTGQAHRSFWTDRDGRHSRVTLVAHQVTVT